MTSNNRFRGIVDMDRPADPDPDPDPTDERRESVARVRLLTAEARTALEATPDDSTVEPEQTTRKLERSAAAAQTATEAAESLKAVQVAVTGGSETTADNPRRHLDQTSSAAGNAFGTEPTGAADQHRALTRATAVPTAWQSSMTAAGALREQVQESAEPAADDAPTMEALREEEVELLELVDPDLAPRARQVGGRMDWSHRRPERATTQPPTRQLGRSI